MTKKDPLCQASATQERYFRPRTVEETFNPTNIGVSFIIFQISNLPFNIVLAFGNSTRSLSVSQAHADGRKAMREGIEMLEVKLLQKDNAAKANLLENRIKRLVFEEQRAKKLTEIANEKAEKLLKARDRHQKDLEAKIAKQ